jgi:hypothetical protein
MNRENKLDEIFALLKSMYAERHNIEVSQIDNDTSEVLRKRAIRICYGSRGINEKADKPSDSGDNAFPAF